MTCAAPQVRGSKLPRLHSRLQIRRRAQRYQSVVEIGTFETACFSPLSKPLRRAPPHLWIVVRRS